MVSENVGPPEAGRPEEAPKILTKPLPQILDEMDGNIRAAAEAARRAQEAAKAAREAAGTATEAAEEAAKRAEEARKAGEKAAEEIRKATEEAAARAEEAFKKAEEALPAVVVKKVLASWELLALLIVTILGSVFAAVAISLGLSLIGR